MNEIHFDSYFHGSQIYACAPQGDLTCEFSRKVLAPEAKHLRGLQNKGGVDSLLQAPIAITSSYRQIVIRRRMFSFLKHYEDQP